MPPSASAAAIALPQLLDRPTRSAGATSALAYSVIPTSPPPPTPAPPHVRAARRLIDSHGRAIADLRLSITDRCNFRCVYCMDPDVRFAPKSELLTVDELVQVASVAADLGIHKIRLTGGEPTLHPNLEEIIARLASATGADIALTTNGSLLSRSTLAAWKRAGLSRVTLSLDSLRPDRYKQLTRSTTSPDAILAAVEMALSAGLGPVKINAVLLRGINDDEAADLAELARRFAVEVRYIEYMPLDSGRNWNPSRWVSANETRTAIERRFELVSCSGTPASSTARLYRFADLPPTSPARIGFIAPISSPFCNACSRLRITADGKVRPCLFSTDEYDMRQLLRGGARYEALADFLIDAAWTKQRGHGIASPEFTQPPRSMSAIGG